VAQDVRFSLGHRNADFRSRPTPDGRLRANVVADECLIRSGLALLWRSTSQRRLSASSQLWPFR
jgi:hypothetical protein